MQVMYKQEIDGYTIIRFIANAVDDPEATKAKILPMMTDEMTKEEIEALYEENKVFSIVGPEAELIEDSVGIEKQRKLDTAGKHRLLLVSGEYISNFKDVEYWSHKTGKWQKEKINNLGENLPADAVLQEDLTEEQQKEINFQNEQDRIASLTPDEKTKEKEAKLFAIAREAISRHDEAELLGLPFDKIAWITPRRSEIEAQYAV